MAAITRSASASPSILLNSTLDANMFPLKSIKDVVKFFKRSLESNNSNGVEPDLTLLSLIAGYVEISLTTGNAAQAAAAAVTAAESSSTVTAANTLGGIVGSGMQASGTTASGSGDIIMGNTVPFPVITYELVAGLYKKFQSLLSAVEKPKSSSRQATREVIKKISDVIWNSLIRSSYKDRAHLQNLYSYLSGNKLDCFGVALAVVAGCQMLGYRDVHLAISEDHAWVVFGNKRVETIEVTWHGKGAEDKRGQDIQAGIESDSWLYLRGMAVVCDRAMEAAAIVAAINISLTTNSDCVEVADMQQKLLWLCYDMGILKKYPMALGSLGELEEINRTHPTITCEQLYREAVQSARQYYRNHHVYPYTYQGNYYNRLIKYREAFASWANAADVIRLYTYSCRDDEEIYKELLDIANEMIPHVMKTESSGHSARSILRDSEVFANLLRFYDGICQWEEDSGTPILHIGWAKPLVNNITKFDYDIRSQIVIKLPEDGETVASLALNIEKEAVEQAKQLEIQEANAKHASGTIVPIEDGATNLLLNNNNNTVNKKDEVKKSTELVSRKVELPTTLADLTAACGEKILNPDFLLQGGGQPFAEHKQQQQDDQEENEQKIKNNNNTLNNDNNIEPKNGLDKSHQLFEAQSQPQQQLNTSEQSTKLKNEIKVLSLSSSPSPFSPAEVNARGESAKTLVDNDDSFEFKVKRPVITLFSQKMKGLKDLLLAEKLNTHAILLQVTAQSVASKKIRGVDKATVHNINSTTLTNYNSSSHHNSTSNNSSSTNSANADSSTNVTSSNQPANDCIAVSRPKRARRE